MCSGPLGQTMVAFGPCSPVVVAAESVMPRPEKVRVTPDSALVVGTDIVISLALGVLIAVTLVA